MNQTFEIYYKSSTNHLLILLKYNLNEHSKFHILQNTTHLLIYDKKKFFQMTIQQFSQLRYKVAEALKTLQDIQKKKPFSDKIV
jgi:hypothetical protein